MVFLDWLVVSVIAPVLGLKSINEMQDRDAIHRALHMTISHSTTAVITRAINTRCVSCLRHYNTSVSLAAFVVFLLRTNFLMHYQVLARKPFSHYDWIETQEPWWWRIHFMDYWTFSGRWSFDISPVTFGRNSFRSSMVTLILLFFAISMDASNITITAKPPHHFGEVSLWLTFRQAIFPLLKQDQWRQLLINGYQTTQPTIEFMCLN